MEKQIETCKLCGRNASACDWFISSTHGLVCSICALEITETVKHQTLQWHVQEAIRRIGVNSVEDDA